MEGGGRGVLGLPPRVGGDGARGNLGNGELVVAVGNGRCGR